MNFHKHTWRYLPTMDTNPPSETRECEVCGRVEQREGVGYNGNVRIEATEWRAARLENHV